MANETMKAEKALRAAARRHGRAVALHGSLSLKAQTEQTRVERALTAALSIPSTRPPMLVTDEWAMARRLWPEACAAAESAIEGK